MEKRCQVKTFEEYVKELVLHAPKEDVEAFKRFWQEGKRIHAIQLLHKYHIRCD